MNWFSQLKKEIVLQASKAIPITISKGICRGMRVFGDLFYNRRSADLNDEEIFYSSLDLRGKVVIEAGAHMGIYSIYFASRVEGGRLISFEPNPVSYDFIRRNLKLNGFDNAVAVHAGLSNQPGVLKLTSNRFNRSVGTFRQDKSKSFKADRVPLIEAEVPVTTVDETVRKYALPRVDFVKIDTEGFESFVIEGMKATLQTTDLILYFEVHGFTPELQRADLERIWRFVSPLDYQVVKLEKGLTGVTEASLPTLAGGAYVAFKALTRDLQKALQHWQA
ncbi:MAG: FkbM family methyltransferase [Verrucomicrobiae bacterium]|nr:FkbM family methyltransferase [Verrucomicrobiae bacterium]